MNTEGEYPRPTFDGDAIKKLIEWYPEDRLYPVVGDHREATKVLTTYIQGVTIGPDGRVHGAFGHKPKTLRLSMKDPNLQNLPRADEAGSIYNYVRGMYVAAPGKVLLARDFSGIEALIVAYLARDKDMLRLCRLGIHDFVASHAIGQPADLSLSDADLKAYFKHYKGENRSWKVAGAAEPLPYEVIRTACKRAVYLSLYLGTPPRMVQAEPEIFPNKKTAKWYQDLFFALFGSVRTWQWNVCEEAERFGFVTAPSGFRGWCWEPFRYTRKGPGQWERSFGEQAKDIVSLIPQHMAMVYGAVAIGKLFQDGIVRDAMRLMIHDEIMTEVNEADVDVVDRKLKEAMEAPLGCMPLAPLGLPGALHVGTEAKMGLIWAHMKERK